jgi:hypothetical protein
MMCSLQIPNIRQEVKYPHSKLKRHHGNYLRLVDVFFKSMYNFNHYISLEHDCIVIEIHDVNPHKIYNPSNFDPSYKVNTLYGDLDFISTFEIFETFYGYLPDIVPYMEFELYEPYGYEYDRNKNLYFGCDTPTNSRGYFERFNLRDLYYQYESRKQQYDVTQRIPSWVDINTQFVG